MLSGLRGEEAEGPLADQRAGQGRKGVRAGSCQKHPGCSSIPASDDGQAPWRGASLGRAGLALEEVLVSEEGLLWGEHGLQAPLGSGNGLHSLGSFVDQ